MNTEIIIILLQTVTIFGLVVWLGVAIDERKSAWEAAKEARESEARAWDVAARHARQPFRHALENVDYSWPKEADDE